MISTEEVQTLLSGGGGVVGPDNEKIGKVGQIFLDDQTSQPEWVTVKTGMFGSAESFVPLAEGTVRGNDIQVPFDKDKVKGAPRVDDSEGHLSQDEEAELYSYYGMDYSEAPSDSGLPTSGTSDGDRTDRSEGDDAMTRSEEQLKVGTEKVESGRARLRKYVVTENVTKTVPVSREEVRLEREPITDANRDEATTGADITEDDHEVTLTEERAVVVKETVPVEKVRMGKETVTGEQEVSEEVRKEQIEAEGDIAPDESTGKR